MTQTFADSFYLLALFNPRDAAHKLAFSASTELQGSLVTTDWILIETADALCDALNRRACAEFIDDLRRSPRVEIISASREWFDAGWDLFCHRLDKHWSQTDCTSFAVMQQHGITDALTGDRHFEQAGFRALLKQET